MDPAKRAERDRSGEGAAPASVRDARCNVLAHLVPPIIHRLNNLLMVVTAGLDVGGAPDGRRSTFPREDSRRLQALLARLSTFARDHSPTRGPFDLCASLANLVELLGPLAEHRGVDLEHRSTLASAHVQGDAPRLEQALAAELGETLVRLGAPPAARRAAASPGPPRPRLCLSVSGAGEYVRFAWVHAGAGTGGETPLAREVGVLARESGARARRRSLGRAHAAALVFPGVPVPRAPAGRAGRRHHGRGASILLVEPNGSLGDLISVVLAEAGHEVVVARGAAEARRLLAAPHELVLVDTEIEFETPDFLRELGQLPGLGAQIALLEGRPELAHARLHPALRKPFRPGQLLDFVRGLAG